MKNLLKTLTVSCMLLIQASGIFAQEDTDNYNSVSLPTINFKAEPVNMFVQPDNGLLLTFDKPGSIPQFFQFSANSNADISLTVQINVADNDNVQTITKEIEISNDPSMYEIPIHSYLASVFLNNPDAVIKSVLFSNRSNAKVMIRETLFSSISVNYPIGINQVFVMDMMAVNKRYFIHSNYYREVNFNVYDIKGTLQKKELITLDPGDNFISEEMLQDLRPGKYVMLVTDAANMNISNTMTVMF